MINKTILMFKLLISHFDGDVSRFTFFGVYIKFQGLFDCNCTEIKDNRNQKIFNPFVGNYL